MSRIARRAEDGPGYPTEAPPTRLRVNALARFISNGAIVATSFVTATITARALGAAGKGTLSTILYIATVCSLAASLGTGEAAAVLARGDHQRLRKMAGLAIPLIFYASIPAISVLLIAAWVAHWSQIWVAVVAACLLIPAKALVVTLIGFQNALERFVQTSLVTVAQVTSEIVFLIAFVLIASMDISGGVIAALASVLVAISLSAKGLHRDGLVTRPDWSLPAAKDMIRVGSTLTSAHVIAALAQRFDLVLVYILLGQAPAGRYAIALSLGQLAAYAANALSVAAFPRLARIDGQEAWRLLPRLSRMSLTSALLSAIIVAAIAPLLIPILFGADFASATAPTLILLLGGILWSELSTLTRSVAALGHQRILLLSFLTFLIIMVALDLFLIPNYGITGAAFASATAAATTLGLFLLWYTRRPSHEPLRMFLPRGQDVLELARFISIASKRALQILRRPRTAWEE